MTKTYKITTQDDLRFGEEITINEIGLCPLCNHAIDPQFISGIDVECEDDEYCCILIFRCTNCHDIFVTRHDRCNSFSRLEWVYPNNAPMINFTDELKEISPQFIKIYSQAKFAEENSLDELAGIGYRKSLEFLIKDFLIAVQHEDETEIKKKMLGNCIELLENPQLKKASTGATWIGNDETHYERRNSDYNINHLKAFIQLTVGLINNEMISKELDRFIR